MEFLGNTRVFVFTSRLGCYFGFIIQELA
jgi:hypothetical protein